MFACSYPYDLSQAGVSTPPYKGIFTDDRQCMGAITFLFSHYAFDQAVAEVGSSPSMPTIIDEAAKECVDGDSCL
jgi:hypothetical protein